MSKMTHLKGNEIHILLDALCNSDLWHINEIFKLKNHLIECQCETLKKSINDSISHYESMQSQGKKLREEIQKEF